VDRLADLRKWGNPAELRYREAEARPAAFDVFAKFLVHVRKVVEKYKAKVRL